MADLPITGLPEASTPVSGNDRLVVAKEISPGVFETQQTPSENLNSPNFLSQNLVNTTGNKSHDFGEFDMLFGKVKTFTAQATVAPTGSNASFNFRGFGTSLSDIQFRESSQLGVIREGYGDRSQKFFGDTVIDTGKKLDFNGSLAFISKSPGSNGLLLEGNGGSHYIGWNSGQYRGVGNLSEDSIIHENTSVNSYFTQVYPSSGSQFKVGRTGSDGAIKLTIGVGFVDTQIITFKQADGTTLFNVDSVGIGASSVVPSAILQTDSTTKGFLAPRMTETQMNAISSPAEGLKIYNTTRGSEMHYHAVFGWLGSSLSMMMGTATTSTVTSATYYFSITQGLTLRSTISGLGVRPTKKCKIIGASFTRFISSILGNRSYSLYVRINDTTDYLVATQATTAVETFFENSALNTTGIPVDVTDSIVMKLVVSGGTTDSTNVLFFGNLLMA